MWGAVAGETMRSDVWANSHGFSIQVPYYLTINMKIQTEFSFVFLANSWKFHNIRIISIENCPRNFIIGRTMLHPWVRYFVERSK